MMATKTDIIGRRGLPVGRNCTGCGGCAGICPRHAVTMQLTDEGFYRPCIDMDMCTGCGLCVEICPVAAQNDGPLLSNVLLETVCHVAWSADDETHRSSSSGGVFTELSRLVMGDRGVAIGCAWNGDFIPEHIVAETRHELKRLQGSKYVPSRVGEAYSHAIAHAKQGTPVLFCGTPCQVAALDRMSRRLSVREHITLVDFICHGVPSLQLFNSYKHWLFSGSKLTDFAFRDKTLCLQTIAAGAESGRRYLRKASDDPFFRLGYGFHLGLMPACFKCRFSTMPHLSDITLGDYWGAGGETAQTYGLSIVFANTYRGLALISKAAASGSLQLKAVDMASAVLKNPRALGKCWEIPRWHAPFLKDVATRRSFTWIYWRWYLPLVLLGKVKGMFYQVASSILNRPKLKKLVYHCLRRRSVAN